MTVRAVRYSDEQRASWDDFVRGSRNGTFLFLRDYMDYHRDRFPDSSWMIEQDGRLIAILPASRKDGSVTSHGGLTYGGLVFDQRFKTPTAVTSLLALCRALADEGVETLHYKAIPSFYARGSSEEDRYALHFAGAQLVRRDVTSLIDLRYPIAFQERRVRSVRKAARAGIVARPSDDLATYWAVLSENLQSRHGRSPVHTLDEMGMLRERFPANIRLFAAYEGDALRAGVLVYETETTAHAQYIASDEKGKGLGALDLLFDYLIREVFQDKPYFDFGNSMAKDGRNLHLGLIDQKEGFGARAAMYDHYQLSPAAGASALSTCEAARESIG